MMHRAGGLTPLIVLRRELYGMIADAFIAPVERAPIIAWIKAARRKSAIAYLELARREGEAVALKMMREEIGE